MIHLRRVYDPPQPSDGECYLVERLWPRGMKKEEVRIAAWLKDVAPSAELRKWYSHDVERWPEFQRRYRAELQDEIHRPLVDELRRKARSHAITLVYAAKDEQHNSALILKQVLERK